MSMILKIKVPAWMVARMEERRGSMSPATFVMASLDYYTKHLEDANTPHGDDDATDKDTVRPV